MKDETGKELNINNKEYKLKPLKEMSEKQQLIRVLYAIEGLTYYEDCMLDETKQNEFPCKVYGLVHGILSYVNAGCFYGRNQKCSHAKYLQEELEEIEARLKFGNILDIDKIFSEFNIGSEAI